ncbi:PQQ-dependent sugar dehydrogenase [Pedobacter insulae]|uniref:Glucose/arabinose dehydrogenase, beta-propeller fold n=1 Tax=Pedobacter insulae TaxID=414048 RepID=A0A1I2V2P8_9SPHI|nr:PQQ-dependent sugar dehydrogenase [Pedobacter insulae]SFG83450.1 Glucose/arabinose dehydrogenase, beta-propeller fold [Pedobacter insulae]
MRKYLIILLVSMAINSCKQAKELPIIDYIQLENTTLKVEVLAKNLDVPWDIAYANDKSLWFAEQKGVISKIDLNTGEQKKLLTITDVWHKRTAGLLGLVVHPNFKNNPYVFVNYTVKKDSVITNHLVRYEFKNDTLINKKILLVIDGFTAHNGSRLAIAKDGKLLWATGDAYKGKNAQNLKSLNGKILRLNTDGSVPKDNPYPNSYVFANGFRNMQGITIGDNGLIYTSEHGDAIEDEVNLIEKGRNYGWPNIEGKHDLPADQLFAAQHQTVEPLQSWTPVIAPAGITYYGYGAIAEWRNSLLLTTLKTKSLRVLKLTEDGRKILSEEVFLKEHYGRLRDVEVGPKGEIYISTSNHDWNPSPGFPLPEDDKILKISIAEKPGKKPLRGVNSTTVEEIKDGKLLYEQYCASCHKADGKGVSNVFPALAGSKKVLCNSADLVSLVLNGAGEQMPAFKFLKDEDVAKIINYINTNWNNKGKEISSSDVKNKRK